MNNDKRKRRLLADRVRAIYTASGTHAEIAHRFGVSYNTAESIRNGGSHIAITGHRPRGKARLQKRLESWRLELPEQSSAAGA